MGVTGETAHSCQTCLRALIYCPIYYIRAVSQSLLYASCRGRALRCETHEPYRHPLTTPPCPEVFTRVDHWELILLSVEPGCVESVVRNISKPVYTREALQQRPTVIAAVGNVSEASNCGLVTGSPRCRTTPQSR